MYIQLKSHCIKATRKCIQNEFDGNSIKNVKRLENVYTMQFVFTIQIECFQCIRCKCMINKNRIYTKCMCSMY